MNLELAHAFDLWDWTTVLGLIGVGVLVGYVLLPYAWPERHAEGRTFPSAMAAVLVGSLFTTFFVFLIVFRYATIDPVVTAKTIGTSIEAIVFALSTGVGLRLHEPRPQRANLDDISAQLNEISRLALATSDSAERAHEAATAADDRVITQAERAVDDRARGIRIEGVSTDTNDRAKDIQGRLP